MKSCSKAIQQTFSSHKNLRRPLVLALLPLAMLVLLCADISHGAVIGWYEFNGSFANSHTGSDALPEMAPVAEGDAGFSAGGWYWNNYNKPSGLRLSMPSSLDEYSVGISFRFSEVNGYKKVFDFSSLINDSGFYINNQSFWFYPAGLAGGSAPGDTLLTVILTRTSGGEVSLYLKGSSDPIIVLDDSIGDFKISNELNFFLDDIVTTGEFSYAGSVSFIGIWDTALSEAEIADVFNPIPEPSLLGLLGGLGVAVFAYRNYSRKLS